jgi:hypothetical protein
MVGPPCAGKFKKFKFKGPPKNASLLPYYSTSPSNGGWFRVPDKVIFLFI